MGSDLRQISPRTVYIHSATGGSDYLPEIHFFFFLLLDSRTWEKI